MSKKFLIIDGNAIVHRAYHALPPLKTRNGKLVNAVYGFLLIFLKALKEIEPDCVVAAFDVKGPTFRHKAYKLYKAKRKKAPDELYQQINDVKKVLKAFGVPVFEKQGFEADDLIGTIVTHTKRKQVLPKAENIILTGDMDALQLVDEQTKVYTMRRSVKDTILFGIKETKEKYDGLLPEQLTDYRALRGDPSDNIPGVTGIGEKTAIELLKQFDTLENLYKEIEQETKNSTKIKEGVLKKLKDYKDQAFISQKLAEIDCNVDIDFKLKDCEFSNYNPMKAKAVLEEFEFFALIKRLPGVEASVKGKAPQQGLFGEEKSNNTIEKEITQLKNQGVFSKELASMEKSLVPVVKQMQENGIRVEIKSLNNLSRKLGSDINSLEKKIFKLSKCEFNLNSPRQMSEVLFDKLEIPTKGIKKTPRGAISTNAKELKKLKNKFPIVDLILKYRELFKLKSGFADALPRMINPKDGRIHPSFHQLGTETGRMSCSEPNLQQVPIKGVLGKEIRKCFVPEKGFLFVSADYSQMELRVMASLANDEKMLGFFKQKKDIHIMTASEVFKVKETEVTEAQRKMAKCVATGTLISTDRGLIPINNLSSAEENCTTPLEINVAQENCFVRTQSFYNGGVQPTIRITTSYGYSLEGTPNHRIRVIDNKGRYVWKRLRDIKVGDLVALKRGTEAFGKNKELKIIFRRRKNKRNNYLPEKMGDELARFLGYVVGEGYLNFGKTSASLNIFNNSIGVIEDLKSLSSILFGKKPSSLPRCKGILLTWSNSRLVEMLQQLGVGRISAEKKVPQLIIEGSKSVATNFLKALFESDGSISKSYITFSSKSKLLVDQVQMLLLNLGIIARREEWEVKPYGIFYKLYLTGRESRIKFFENVGFVSRKKQQKLAKLVQRRFTSEGIHLPNQIEGLKAMYPFVKNNPKERIHTCIRTKSPTINLTYQRLEKILEEFPKKDLPEYTALKAHHERNIFYNSVVKLQEYKSQTYDLVVPITNTYIANGFISHNTIGFGVLYGMGPYGLSDRTGVSVEEAKAFIDQYFLDFNGIAKFIEKSIEETKQNGFSETLFGRKRFLPEINSRDHRLKASAERMARNFPAQGASADIMKMAMVDLAKNKVLNKDCRLLLQIHDELLFEVVKGKEVKIAEKIKKIMENVVKLKVPMIVNIGIGKNWGDV